ncbi:MAG: hypothetical protein H6773_02050 [Pseudomonadales bacterium]|nr:hypothetical protein [Pseudomonadales bacterium]
MTESESLPKQEVLQSKIEFAVEYKGEGYVVTIDVQKIKDAILQELLTEHSYYNEKAFKDFLDSLDLSFVTNESPSDLRKFLTKLSDLLKTEKRKRSNLPSTPIDNLAFINATENGVEAQIDLQHIVDIISKKENPLATTIDDSLPSEYRERILKEKLTDVIKMVVTTIASCYTDNSRSMSALQKQYLPAEHERSNAHSNYVSFITSEKMFKLSVAFQAILYPGYSDVGQAYLRALIAIGLTGWVVSDIGKKLSQAPADKLAREVFETVVTQTRSKNMVGENEFVGVSK